MLPSLRVDRVGIFTLLTLQGFGLSTLGDLAVLGEVFEVELNIFWSWFSAIIVSLWLVATRWYGW